MGNKIEVGAVVRLKSGSIKMTLEKIISPIIYTGTAEDIAECVWFDNNQFYRKNFTLVALELAENQ